METDTSNIDKESQQYFKFIKEDILALWLFQQFHSSNISVLWNL
jgi:hypothetical protein